MLGGGGGRGWDGMGWEGFRGVGRGWERKVVERDPEVEKAN